ncbi:hypothetical protein EDB81DRAFT_500820 [Dactylonectria macrodidyma]|uniref:Uncharacterized protein n=1 Tax=Dactylonectria macrodidyma TaxID=307937 RepID=A0A9P9ESI9_9HYPO|nr:hypothetical protein EDB81DRAFT_500820 [Dactylonectria macrodidyma]
MWRFIIIPFLVQNINALPAARDATGTCPHDALYTSLSNDGIDFCSSVIGNGHCTGGYNTPPAYVTYNQTQVSSYCRCILTNSSAAASSISSGTATTGGFTATSDAPNSGASGQSSASTSKPPAGRPAPGQTSGSFMSSFSSTTRSPSSTGRLSNGTRPVSSMTLVPSTTSERTANGASSFISPPVDPPVDPSANGTSRASRTDGSEQSSSSMSNISTITSPGSQVSGSVPPVTTFPSFNTSGTLPPSTLIGNATSESTRSVNPPGRIPPDGATSRFASWNLSVTSFATSFSSTGVNSLPGPDSSSEMAYGNATTPRGTILPVPTPTTSFWLGNSTSTTPITEVTPPTSSSTQFFNGTRSQVDGASSATMTEFPAINFTRVTRTGAVSQETCYSLAQDSEGIPPRRAVLRNSQLREENATIPIPYIESVQFDHGGVDPLYLTVRDVAEGSYFIDVSNTNQITIIDTEDNSMLLDAGGIYFSTRNCTYGVSIEINNMLQQLATLSGVQCAASESEKRKRAEDLDFRQVLILHDQCRNPVGRTLRHYPQLRVGASACADTDVDETTGRWEFDCMFPGSLSGSMRCQWAIKNDVVDFLLTDPFGSSCPDLATVITTLEATGQDFLNVESFRTALYSQRLNETQKPDADAAAAAFEQLWEVLRQVLSKSRTEPPGESSAIEEYITLYNTYRNLENDICEDLHAGEIPLSLSLIAGVTRIEAITTLNWAPDSPRTYNITIQDASEVACCPNGAEAGNDGDTCAYPDTAIIENTNCICGTAGAASVAFEYTECDNYVSTCNSDGDCEDAGYSRFVCLTGSCCGGGVCVDPYACSQNGTELVKLRDQKV